MLKIISIEPGAASMSYDLRAAGLGYIATVWAGGKAPSDQQARQNAADIKAALDAIAGTSPAIRLPKIKARRWFDLTTYGRTYKESDADYVANNLAACVWFLENRDKVKIALGVKA